MELGGKNPLIVMEDADLDQAVDLAIKGGLSLTGQACTGTSRILVMEQVREAFTEKLVAACKALKIGSGIDAGHGHRPAGDGRAARDRAGVRRDRQAGGDASRAAASASTGEGYDRRLLRVAGGVHRREPVDAHRARRDLRPGAVDHRGGRATRTRSPRRTTPQYGLSAAIATRNPRYMHDFANDIQSGTVKINRTTTGNLINAPFGGLKRSSTSTFRESGRTGLEFYTQIKTVYRGC